MEVGLVAGDFVLDGDAASPPPQKKSKHSPYPLFGPCLLWPHGWMDENATWCGSRPRPRTHCVRLGPSSPRERGTPGSPISAAAELLLKVFFAIFRFYFRAVDYAGKFVSISANAKHFHVVCHLVVVRPCVRILSYRRSDTHDMDTSLLFS